MNPWVRVLLILILCPVAGYAIGTAGAWLLLLPSDRYTQYEAGMVFYCVGAGVGTVLGIIVGLIWSALVVVRTIQARRKE